ncbi:MAG: hypothetical protein ABSB90_03315 [Thermoplasmata archaeon]|jgi:tetratricopeptide (TPR) repeat protein
MALTKTERELHRKMGTRCFNEAWDYLEKRHRTARDDRQLLHLVHASRYHWDLAGTAQNRAIADWQVSRAYAALRSPTLAIQFARSALDLCEENDLAEFLATAYEAMARAHATAGELRPARQFLSKARAQLDVSPLDAEGREVYRSQIRETERLVQRAAKRRRPA